MLNRKGNRFELYPHKVKYTQHGETIEQWAFPNKEWWENFADFWDHTEIIEFTELELSAEQISRFKDVQDMPEDFTEAYIEYMLTGVFADFDHLPSTHPFQIVLLRNENKQLKTDLGNVITRSANIDTGFMEFLDYYFESGGM